MTNGVLCPCVDQSWTYCPSLDIHLNFPMKYAPKRMYVEISPVYDCRL